MDFVQILTKETKGGVLEISPDFTVGRSKDLMVRGGAFYAVWDEKADDGRGLWSTDEYDVQRIVDELLYQYGEKLKADGIACTVKYLRSFNTNGWKQFKNFMKSVSDNSHQLDQKLTFANTDVKKTDYVSRRLSYPLASGDHSTWDRLLEKLYAPDERAKIEWTIGAIISGDSKKLQKFLVLYGPGGTGKSTILNIVQKLFEGYIATFEAKSLVGNNNSFAIEAFKHNPLVAIQHDGDLSKIEDNTKLNSVISHEDMLMNEKYKSGYTVRINAMLLMGTNKPVKITDAKSGIIRRLIDAHPTGNLFTPNEYNAHMSKIDFELGAIAHHCLEVYQSMGKNFYNSYRPLEMMLQTDVFFNYVEANYDIFKSQDGTSLKQAYGLYQEFVTETGVDWKLPQYKFREELRNYFEEFHDRITINGHIYRSYYTGFKGRPTRSPVKSDIKPYSLVMEETKSILDDILQSQPAQYANAKEFPSKYWTHSERLIDGELKVPDPSQVVNTVLSDLDTTKLHYVKVPMGHIVIDFDLKDEEGNKSLQRNLEAASEWPPTYAEFSKSGAGIHLHYIYDGDVSQLAREFAPGIEVKVYAGDSALRRRLSRCNNLPIASISSGLPLREKKVLQAQQIKSERGLRELIIRNLRKEIHPGTKPSIDFIHKILEGAYKDPNLVYDVTDLRAPIIAFANNSTNWGPQCLRVVKTMKFKSADESERVVVEPPKDKPNVFYDVEVFPNLFVICWKYQGSPTVVRMINPSPREVEALLQYKLIGFYNRNYDNHILWGRMLGYDNQALYELSQRIIEDKSNRSKFGEAYNLSYTDIHDFSSVKQSLKKFEIELGLKHMELDLPWDKPVPEELWDKVVEYCVNDVEATEAVFEARKHDFVAREILADLSGLTVNDTTNSHSARIIFGQERYPQREFNYVKLAEQFPGYIYEAGKSTYKGEVTGEGGYVYAEPGMHKNVVVLDVASMHPSSIIAMNMFGDRYTPRFKELMDARLFIKREDWAGAKKILGGKLTKYIEDIQKIADEEERKKAGKQLSDALKIVINSVYGLTSASFENPFRDNRNKDNIVAKRGALFMIDLKHFVQDEGFDVIHIKTDSIKIPDATPEIIEKVKEFGQKYGYTFEYDPKKDYYDQLCLVNEAVYIARHDEKGQPKWEAVGAQFQHPYVMKALFTNEFPEFKDFREIKSVNKGAIYMDFSTVERDPKDIESMHFVGKTGVFVPVKDGYGGAVLYRVQDGKPYAVTGTKGYLWLEADMAEKMYGDECVDRRYFEELAEKAREAIDFRGPFSEFVAR